ncbi:MAG: DUF5397 family protein [Pseudomonadota bacterium]
MRQYPAKSRFRRTATHTAVATPPVPVGLVKSFGPFGPKYRVGRVLRPLEDGDWLIEIAMLETGESAEYRLTRMQDDPVAR